MPQADSCTAANTTLFDHLVGAAVELLSPPADGGDEGLGIALLPYRTVRDDFKNATLIELLKGQPIPERPLYAAFAPGAPLPEKVYTFADHLSEWFRSHPL